MQIKFTIITLFPEALQPYLESSMLYKAQDRGIIGVEYVNLRDFGLGPHKSVDDTPYGGGDGMLLRPEPVFAAVESIKNQDPEAEVILPTPVGMTWNQALARQFAGVSGTTKTTSATNTNKTANTTNATEMTNANHVNAIDTREGAETSQNTQNVANTVKSPKNGSTGEEEISQNGQKATLEALGDHSPSTEPSNIAMSGKLLKTPSTTQPRHFIILCPHYEGYDERILAIVDHQISLGNYVLTGGELPALIIIDSITRLLPGVLGGETSAEVESFSDGDNLEYPQYTKPAEFRGMKVPEVLLSGHHGKIAEWRAEQSKARRQRRQ